MHRIALFAALVVPAACSGRSHDAGPTTSPEPGGAAAPAAAAADPGTRRARPLDGAALDRLAAVTIAGHDVAVARRGPADLAAIVTTPGGTRVTVTASACLGCAPMSLAAWEARRAELAALWAPSESGGDSLAIAAPELAKQTVIAVDARRTLEGEARRIYQLHWNDGAAQLAAVCETSDDCPAAAAAALAPYLAALTD